MKSSRVRDDSGYRPLILPRKGEDLIPDRQYALSPVARLVIEEMYGLKGVPTFVTCIRCKVAKTKVTRIIENLETGIVHKTEHIVEPQAATFSAFLSLRNRLVFTVDLDKVHELEPFYAKSPSIAKYERTCELLGNSAASPTRKAPVKIDLSIFD